MAPHAFSHWTRARTVLDMGLCTACSRLWNSNSKIVVNFQWHSVRRPIRLVRLSPAPGQTPETRVAHVTPVRFSACVKAAVSRPRTELTRFSSCAFSPHVSPQTSHTYDIRVRCAQRRVSSGPPSVPTRTNKSRACSYPRDVRPEIRLGLESFTAHAARVKVCVKTRLNLKNIFFFFKASGSVNWVAWIEFFSSRADITASHRL